MTLDEQIISMTTRVECGFSACDALSRGTGFFYADEGGEGREWLVTNRHVVFHQEAVTDFVEFFLRRRVTDADGSAHTDEHPVRLGRREAYADLTLNERLGYCRLSGGYLPGSNPVRVETASDVIVCSYPHGFYDTVNKYPIIKSGIVASSWGKLFEGDPCFLIDCQLFPGSSGGLVLSKPADIRPTPDYAHIPAAQRLCGKQYALLGIFSHTLAKPLPDEDGKIHNKELGLGIVWYGELISEIVKDGVAYNPE